MALCVNFKIEKALEEALATFKGSNDQRAIIATIEKEEMHLHGSAIAKTADFTGDMSNVREAIRKADLPACFVIVKVGDEQKHGLILYTPDGIKPKTRMMYASSSAHLRKESHLAIGSDIHAVTIEEISTSLFGRDWEGDRKILATESEKAQQEIEKMEVAPSHGMMPFAGVNVGLSDDAKKGLEAFKANEHRAVAFSMEKGQIHADKVFAVDASDDDLVAGLPDNQPRYLLTRWKKKKTGGDDEEAAAVVVLVYLCPGAAKPRDRMPYSSSKSSFVSQIKTAPYEIKLDRNMETDDPKDMPALVMEEIMAAPCVEEEEPKQIVAKSTMPRGPRMLI